MTTLTISKNGTFGQIYLEKSTGEGLRVPRQSVPSFLLQAEIPIPGQRLVLVGERAQSVWETAQQYAG